jgi:hypothetical protein
MHPGQKQIVDTLTKAIKGQEEKSNIEIAARELLNILETHGDWDDGCYYYNHLSATELEQPMQALADALNPTRDRVTEPDGIR